MQSGLSGLAGFLTIEEAAEYLRVSRWTLYKWAAEGRVPCLRLGKLLRFERVRLDEWMRSGAGARG